MASLIRAAWFKSSGTTVPSGVICAWPSTAASIPTGWTRETTLDARFVKMIATNGTNPGATGGGDHTHALSSHSHTTGSHTHSGTSTGPSTTRSDRGPGTDAGATISTGSHTHPTSWAGITEGATGAGTGNTDSTSGNSEPPFFVVIFIKSDGTPAGLPNAALAYFNAAAPTGWTAYAGSLNRLMKGAATGGNGGGTGGTADSHTHTLGHSHAASGATHSHGLSFNAPGASGINRFPSTPDLPDENHTHAAILSSVASSDSGLTGSGTATNAGDATPPWTKQLVIENTSGIASLPLNVIALWNGTLASIPTAWKLCDGTVGTPNLANGKFVRGTNVSGDVGTIGGAATHNHTDAGHTHPGSAHTHPSEANVNTASNLNLTSPGSTNLSTATHTHSSGISSTGSSTSGSTVATLTAATNDPVFTTVAYIQYQG